MNMNLEMLKIFLVYTRVCLIVGEHKKLERMCVYAYWCTEGVTA